jgi:FtsP/CotA-like multicopper oxidase with cupredoxin domain
MSNPLLWSKLPRLSRRQLLKYGLAVGALGGGIGLVNSLSKSSARSSVRIPTIDEQILANNTNPFNPMAVLRDFDYGKVKKENGRVVREFTLTAHTSPIQLNNATSFVSWNVNDRVPGPTLRANEGDRVRVIFRNRAGHSHSLHFHGTHPAEMDGIEPVRNRKETIYEFDAKPYGVHLYHCHIAPVTRHIGKGLYGMFIIDPPQGRSPADEMVMVMGAYDTNNDKSNELYVFNGIPNYYRDNPIRIYQNQLVRVYLLNMIEFDPAVTFHIHGNMFQVYRTGRTLTPSEETDVITMGTAERHILEFTYTYPGKFMFHPHQDAIAEQGCMGNFEVIPN